MRFLLQQGHRRVGKTSFDDEEDVEVSVEELDVEGVFLISLFFGCSVSEDLSDVLLSVSLSLGSMDCSDLFSRLFIDDVDEYLLRVRSPTNISFETSLSRLWSSKF